MAEVILALMKALMNLRERRIWWLVLAPALVSLLLWLGLTFFVLDLIVAQFLQLPPMTWLTGWGAIWLAKFFAVIGGWLVILAAAYVTAMLLAAIFILPLLLRILAERDYRDVARLGRDSVLAAVGNSVVATLGFVAGWLLTLPLWLIPGFGLVLPLFWMAWLTRRTFAYDAACVHATDAEWQRLTREHRTPLLWLGVIMGLLGHVPLIGLLVPTVAALAYIHYCLNALRQLRGPQPTPGEGLIIEGELA